MTVLLLLDEMFSPGIAAELRQLGHDALAVAERPDLRSKPDDEAFPRSRKNPGPLVRALDAWLTVGPPAPPIVEAWLTETALSIRCAT